MQGRERGEGRQRLKEREDHPWKEEEGRRRKKKEGLTKRS